MSTSRRDFLKTLGGMALLTIVPRQVLGGPKFTAPSDQLTKGIIGVGGISQKSPFVMQMLADVIGKKIDVSECKQSCALGSAICASVVGGIYPTIEAAQKARNLAPGLRRRFAAEHYDFVPAAVWAEERQKALAASRLDAGFEGFGFDIDPNAVALANANAKLAGVGDRCRFEVADVKDFAPRPSSIILTNPPYGERLGDAAEAAALARTLGQVWQASPTAGLYAITADADFEAHFGKKAAKRRKIYNGMIPCQIYMYFDRPVKPVRK